MFGTKMAETVRGVSALQSELEKAKESLKDVDENIKKLTGRDPTLQRPVVQRRVSLGVTESRESREPRREVGAGRSGGDLNNRLFNLARRGIIQDESPAVKRRPVIGGAFSRLGPRPGERDQRDRGRRGQDSGDEEDYSHRPALQSSVIATPKEERSRQNSIEEQAKDRKGQARNRRMFGALLGTLQRFKDDAAVTKEKEEQRIQIEKKLDDKFKHEKDEIIRERRELFLERRKKQFRIKLLEQKMEMAQNHDNWVIETRKLDNFIRTKTRPHLFYMPKILTKESEEKLKLTKKVVDGMIEDHRKKLEADISAMMSQLHDRRDDHEDDGDGEDGEDDNEDDTIPERDTSMRDERDTSMRDERDTSMRDEQGESGGESGGEGDTRERLRSSEENGAKVSPNKHGAKVSPNKHGDDKENSHEHKREKGEDLEERIRRDKEREQRDKDRQMKDKLREERRNARKNEGGRKEKVSESGRKGRSRSRDRKEDKDKKTGRDRSSDNSRSRERHRSSGKNRSEKRSRDHSGSHDRSNDRSHDRSHGHSSSSKSKRRSKGEGKGDKKEKVWAPMEDEVEEVFTGSKGDETEPKLEGSIASKMLAMAGMTDVMREALEREKAMTKIEEQFQEAESVSIPGLGDIPAPTELGNQGVNVEEGSANVEIDGEGSLPVNLDS